VLREKNVKVSSHDSISKTYDMVMNCSRGDMVVVQHVYCPAHRRDELQSVAHWLKDFFHHS
jgi:hypothetical protein